VVNEQSLFSIFYKSYSFSVIKPVNSRRNTIVLEKEKTILGIDPGSNVMGYGVVKVVGTKAQIVTLGVVKT
jgi:crossover junction endodeoxyribonuclease RuvC